MCSSGAQRGSGLRTVPPAGWAGQGLGDGNHPVGWVSRLGAFGQDQNVFALMLALPATLIGLVALLAITSGLERQLAASVRPAHLRASQRRVPVPVTKRR